MGELSPGCTDLGSVWTTCLFQNPMCLVERNCDVTNNNNGVGDDAYSNIEAIRCQMIPLLCEAVACCNECHLPGIELLNCQAEAQSCSNECEIPTSEPTPYPTLSISPSDVPTKMPSFSPSKNPSSSPLPSMVPSDSPTDLPSSAPTSSLVPSSAPTAVPSSSPSAKPTITLYPSVLPTVHLSSSPSEMPSKSLSPSAHPTGSPSSSPSEKPSMSSNPSLIPTKIHSEEPTSVPSTVAPAPTIPPELVGRSDYRCGVTEADARSNCKNECTTDFDCEGTGEVCWTTHLNYCYVMPPNHPQCSYTAAENEYRRCGYNEMAARGFCGQVCTNELECTEPGEKCYPVMRNMCQCFEEQDVLDQVIPDRTEWVIAGVDNFRRNVIEQKQKKEGDNKEENTEIYRRDLGEDFIIMKMPNRAYFDSAKEPFRKYYVGTYQENSISEEQENSVSAVEVNSAQRQPSGATTAATNSKVQYLMIGSSLLLVISYLL